jgi:hypothetical protein
MLSTWWFIDIHNMVAQLTHFMESISQFDHHGIYEYGTLVCDRVLISNARGIAYKARMICRNGELRDMYIG